MELGNFSVSLAVKDLAASQSFYEALGFRAAGGDPEGGWLIMINPSVTIGLFKGMFEKNMLTFNPGWSQDAEPLDAYEDVRAIQARLKDADVDFASEADPDGNGPASFIVVDPDGNPILIDQHV